MYFLIYKYERKLFPKKNHKTLTSAKHSHKCMGEINVLSSRRFSMTFVNDIQKSFY